MTQQIYDTVLCAFFCLSVCSVQMLSLFCLDRSWFLCSQPEACDEVQGILRGKKRGDRAKGDSWGGKFPKYHVFVADGGFCMGFLTDQTPDDVKICISCHTFFFCSDMFRDVSSGLWLESEAMGLKVSKTDWSTDSELSNPTLSAS